MGTSATPQPIAPTAPAAVPPIPSGSFMGMPTSVPARADTFIDRMLARYGNAENALREMAQQIVQYADAATSLEGKLKAVEGKLPPDGAVVIPKDQAPLWQAVTEAKLTPDTLKTTLKEHREWGGQMQAASRKDLSTKLAKAAGYANADILDSELDRRGMIGELRPAQVMQNGKPVTVEQAYVRPKDKADAALEPLGVYVDREFAEPYKIALRATPTGSPPAGNATAPVNTTAPTTGYQWPTQTRVGGQSTDAGLDPVAKFQKDAQKARDERPSPLTAAISRGTRIAPQQGGPGESTPA